MKEIFTIGIIDELNEKEFLAIDYPTEENFDNKEDAIEFLNKTIDKYVKVGDTLIKLANDCYSIEGKNKELTIFIDNIML